MLITPIQRIPRIILLLQSKHISFIAKQVLKSVIIARKKYFAAHTFNANIGMGKIGLAAYIHIRT